MQGIVDESDEKLTELRKEWGEEAYKAVVDALSDLNEYNPSVKRSVPELWNFNEQRRAHLKEVIEFIAHHWEIHRKKYTEQSAAIIDLMAEEEKLFKRLTDMSILLGEKDKLLNEKYAGLGKLMSQDVQKDEVVHKWSATKNIILQTSNAGYVEERKTQGTKQQVDKLKHNVQYRKEELGKQTRVYKKRKGLNDGCKGMAATETESLDCLDSFIDQVQPLAKKLEGLRAQNTNEGTSSTSEHKKLQDQNMGLIIKDIKVEPDMLDQPPVGNVMQLMGAKVKNTPPSSTLQSCGFLSAKLNDEEEKLTDWLRKKTKVQKTDMNKNLRKEAM